MSTEQCACDDLTLGNLGSPSCNPVAKVTKRLILMPAFNVDGERNGIDLDDTLDATWIADKINQYLAAGTRNPLDERWYPTPLLENVTDERADTQYEEFPSGKKSKVREGIRSFSAEIVDYAAFELLGKLERNECTQLAALIIDQDGSVIGDGATDSDKLLGILIDKDSLDHMLIKATDTTTQKIRIMFDWHRLAKDRDLRMIKASDFSGFSMLDISGSYDVYGTLGTITTTSIIISLRTSYGSLMSPIPVPLLVAADFKLYNRTDSLAVVVVSVTEDIDVPGKYTITFAAQTALDVMQVLIKKGGLDGTAVEALTPAIP